MKNLFAFLAKLFGSISSIEFREQALRSITSTNILQNLGVDSTPKQLSVWIAATDTDSAEWVNAQFADELLSRLQQDRYNTVRKVIVKHGNIDDVKLQGRQQLGDRIFYSIDPFEPSPAWLTVTKGGKFLDQHEFTLNPKDQKIWNIGRSECPDGIIRNHIVIKDCDDCRDISRYHAVIELHDDGEYYLKCRRQGSSKGGDKKTAIIKEINNETISITLEGYDPHRLKHGDKISLLKGTIVFQFSLTNPRQ